MGRNYSGNNTRIGGFGEHRLVGVVYEAGITEYWKWKVINKSPPGTYVVGSGAIVATQASVISAAREKMLMDFSSKSLIGKAKARPDQVKQVMDRIKQDGLTATLQTAFAC